MRQTIKILLIDDHTLFRSGLKFLLQQQPDFNVIGESANGLDGVKIARKLAPDIVLLDLDMPSMNGLEVLPQLLNDSPDLIVIMLTVSEDSADLKECMLAGAQGYLLKNINTEFLINSIRQAMAGDSVLSPEMTSKLINQFKKGEEPSDEEDKLKSLTPRELEILSWLAKGASNKVIANKLDVAESTVKVHVQNLLRKLNLRSRVHAAIYAVEKNIS